MSTSDKMKNKAEDSIGKIKEKVGDATDNESMENEGRSDQAKAAGKQAGEHVKDAARDAKDSVKDTFKN